MDRLRLSVKDDMLYARVNDKEIFPEGVKDADLKAGTVGLYSENPAVFDNVEIGK
jgi:hypothetical protein